MSAGPAPLVEVTTQGIRWQVLAEHRDRLLGPHGLRLDEWLHNGHAHIIKQGPHRAVYRVSLPGLDFFLKHYRLMDARAWLRQLVRPPKARMEYDRALAVAARQVPTITPLGLGERGNGRVPGESFLLTESLTDVEPLSTFFGATFVHLDRARQSRLRQRLAKDLGTFLDHVHQAGIVHRDLHAGNLLLRLEPDDRFRFFLIDLHDVHVGRPLDWRARRDNLVMFNRWFSLQADRTDRLRFWKAYAANRPGGQTPFGINSDLVRELEHETSKSNVAFWRQRDRRSLVTNRYYVRIRSPELVGYAVRDLDNVSLRSLIDDPDEPFRRPGINCLKDSPSSTVVEFEVAIAGVSRRVVYKRFRATSWSDPLAALFRNSAALRSWIHGHGLRERCLPTPRPVAMFHRRRHGLLYDGYLLVEKVADVVDLHDSLNDLASQDRNKRRRLVRLQIDRVARLVRELHHCRLSHRDLKAANILVQRSVPESRGRQNRDFGPMWLIDLAGVQLHRRLWESRRIKDLARLHASFHQSPALTRTDKLRFLRVYQQWGLFGQEKWKHWWKAIEQATVDKVIRNRRNGRPLA